MGSLNMDWASTGACPYDDENGAGPEHPRPCVTDASDAEGRVDDELVVHRVDFAAVVDVRVV